MRVGVSSILLWVLWLISRGPAGIQKKHIGRFILCAITGVAINQSLFIQGLAMTLSIHAALLILVTPVFISVAAFWLGTENLTVLKLIGLCISISGAVILALQKEQGSGASNIFWGDVFIIVNAISYAIYFSLVKPLMKIYSPVQIIRWVFTFGLLFMVPIGWNQFSEISWSSLGAIDWGLIGFVVLGATFFAYLFNLYGIHQLGAAITGTYIYTQPVFAALIAIFILGEKLTFHKILAALLIFGGVYLVSRKNNPSV